jgi:hypothetical protein
MPEQDQEEELYLDWYLSDRHTSCPGCGASWQRTGPTSAELLHDIDCPYIAWEDLPDEIVAIETPAWP